MKRGNGRAEPGNGAINTRDYFAQVKKLAAEFSGEVPPIDEEERPPSPRKRRTPKSRREATTPRRVEENRDAVPLKYRWLDAIYALTETSRDEEKPGLPAPTRHCLLILARHMQKDGTHAWPSQELIAAETGMHVEVVRRHLRLATAKKWLKREKTRRTSRGLAYEYRPAFPSEKATVDRAIVDKATDDCPMDDRSKGNSGSVEKATESRMNTSRNSSKSSLKKRAGARSAARFERASRSARAALADENWVPTLRPPPSPKKTIIDEDAYWEDALAQEADERARWRATLQEPQEKGGNVE